LCFSPQVDNISFHQIRLVAQVCSSLSDPIWTAARHSGLGATEPSAKPCIVLAPHPSLRFGPALQLLPLFAANSSNMLMLTDPDTRCASVMKPFDTAKLLYRVVEVLSYLTRSHRTRCLIFGAETGPIGCSTIAFGGQCVAVTLLCRTSPVAQTRYCCTNIGYFNWKRPYYNTGHL
jgi:hypothetical protein